MLKNIFVSFIALFSAFCSHVNEEHLTYTDWDILEKFVAENWTKKKLISVLGEPKHKIERSNNKGILFAYFDLTTGHQRWAFSFTMDDRANGVSFIPYEKKHESFSEEIIKKRWSSLNCQIKWERKIISDLIKDTKMLDCDQGHRVYYQNGEISSIDITK